MLRTLPGDLDRQQLEGSLGARLFGLEESEGLACFGVSEGGTHYSKNPKSTVTANRGRAMTPIQKANAPSGNETIQNNGDSGCTRQMKSSSCSPT